MVAKQVNNIIAAMVLLFIGFEIGIYKAMNKSVYLTIKFYPLYAAGEDRTG